MARATVTVLAASLALLRSAFRVIAALLLGRSFSLWLLFSPWRALLLWTFATGLVVSATVPTGWVIVAAFTTFTAFAWFALFTAWFALLAAFVLFFFITALALLILVAFTTVAAALGLLATAFL